MLPGEIGLEQIPKLTAVQRREFLKECCYVESNCADLVSCHGGKVLVWTMEYLVSSFMSLNLKPVVGWRLCYREISRWHFSLPAASSFLNLNLLTGSPRPLRLGLHSMYNRHVHNVTSARCSMFRGERQLFAGTGSRF